MNRGSGRAAKPRWFDPDAAPLLFYYDKAFGLGFDPRSQDTPMLYGGDYDGMRPIPASDLLGERLRRELESHHMEWIFPYLKKLVRGDDFKLSQLLAVAKHNGRPPFTRSDIR